MVGLVCETDPTIVTGPRHILYLQGPLAPRGLIPGVGAHEGPVVEAF